MAAAGALEPRVVALSGRDGGGDGRADAVRAVALLMLRGIDVHGGAGRTLASMLVAAVLGGVHPPDERCAG